MEKVSMIFIFWIFIYSGLIFGQNKADLERQRRETQEIIENTTRLLRQTSASRLNSVEKLNIVNRRLQLRQSLINTIESEIGFLDRSVATRQERITGLEKELAESRESYAELIRIAYKQRFTYQRLMFIMSAVDFNQSYRRLKYLQQYGRSRQKQIERINLISSEISNEIEVLENQRDEKVILLQQQQNETNLLSRERIEQNSIIQELSRREVNLKQELAEQEKIARALQNAIEELLKEEARIAAEGRTYELTPEEKIISSQFKENMGGLPWPTSRGVVTGFFGEHPHPVLRGIKTQNNGILISTVEHAEVMVLFDGVVRQIITVPGSNNVVLVKHGSFFTVYANLAHVYVRPGDRVVTKQLIGRVFTDGDEPESSILHLEIWEENRKLDPILWLSRQ